MQSYKLTHNSNQQRQHITFSLHLSTPWYALILCCELWFLLVEPTHHHQPFCKRQTGYTSRIEHHTNITHITPHITMSILDTPLLSGGNVRRGNRCCCCDSRRGTIIVSIIDILLSILILVLLTIEKRKILSSNDDPDYVNHINLYYLLCMIFDGVGMGISILAIIGAILYNRRLVSRFLIVYILVCAANCQVYCLLMLTYICQFLDRTEFGLGRC